MIEAAITLGVFMVAHLCGTVWWMSRIQTTLDILVKTLQDISVRTDRELTIRDSKLEAAWKAIDEINSRCMERGRGFASTAKQVEMNDKRLEDLEHKVNK